MGSDKVYIGGAHSNKTFDCCPNPSQALQLRRRALGGHLKLLWRLHMHHTHVSVTLKQAPRCSRSHLQKPTAASACAAWYLQASHTSTYARANNILQCIELPWTASSLRHCGHTCMSDWIAPAWSKPARLAHHSYNEIPQKLHGCMGLAQPSRA